MKNGQHALTTETANAEWELSELVDAIAAEIDKAGDTLSLKSYARGMSFAIKQIDLDLEVNVRRDPDGRVLFRTVEPDQPSATVLKLNFAQVLQSQLQGVRKPLDRGDARPLSTLPGITDDEMQRLNAIAIYSVDDLERYTQTGAMLAEVSRKTGIADPRLRFWRRLPFLSEIKPPVGAPGSTVLIEGGNFGATPDPNAVFLFQGQPATVQSWSENRITLTMPHVAGTGLLFGVIGTQPTNTLDWEAVSVDLFVRNLALTPENPSSEDVLTIEADMVNQGSAASPSFQVEWTLNGQRLDMLAHGPLQPGQRSQESSTRYQLRQLPAGNYTIGFTADPQATLPDLDRANSTFSRSFTVLARQQLVIGDFRDIRSLDPLANDTLGPADVLGLIFRGLVLNNPRTGQLIGDLAEYWGINYDSDATRIRLTFSNELRFHDGSPLTVEDVAFTYKLLLERGGKLGTIMRKFIRNMVIESANVIMFETQGPMQIGMIPSELWHVPILPKSYLANQDQFASKPNGNGPFQVERFEPGKQIALRAFESYHKGKPRADRLLIEIRPAADLIDGLLSKRYAAATLPFDQGVATKLQSAGLNVTPLPSFRPQLLHVQQPNLNERSPNESDIAWNAHLWYLS